MRIIVLEVVGYYCMSVIQIRNACIVLYIIMMLHYVGGCRDG